MTHDRLVEAHYFLHGMEREYHQPASFRYNVNAFLSALRSAIEMLRVEMESIGKAQWMKGRKEDLYADEVLLKFFNGRNIVLHRRALLTGSEVRIGLYRNLTPKLTPIFNVDHDESSASLLTRMLPHFYGYLIDEEHAALGEQIGLRRLYYSTELGASRDGEADVFSVSHRALARAMNFHLEAHREVGQDGAAVDEELALERVDLKRVSTLLETDLDPEAPRRWGWYDIDDDSGDDASIA